MSKKVILLENAKPFLKWAGGKGQLLSAIEATLSKDIWNWDSFTYIEPFVGSGAVLFFLLKSFPNLKEAVINDTNPDLTKAFSIIKNEPNKLITTLSKLQTEYYKQVNEDLKREYFLLKREKFNTRNLDDIENTALLIFLNRTCFNGLYRVNSKNLFNVPFGKYTNPKICDSTTILSDSLALQKVKIMNKDFEKCLKYANTNTLFYIDPPYKPISATSHFTAYSSDKFNDIDQKRLKNFCDSINERGSHFVLSNSDLKNHDDSNNFFDDLYSDYRIERVEASRNINSVATKRGKIYELLISNSLNEPALQTT
jgi:DNA adenine methylase